MIVELLLKEKRRPDGRPWRDVRAVTARSAIHGSLLDGGRPGHVGRNSDKGNRLFAQAVIRKFRTGAPWRDLPERSGDWKNAHVRFS